jgi:putative transposase
LSTPPRKELQKVEEYIAGIEPEKFWEELANAIRGSIRITLEKAISYEFSSFVGALEYERSPERRDVRNGHRKRDFETVYGVLKDIAIPRARKSSFTSGIIPRFQRRQGKIGHLISKIFLLGLSTRDISKISKHIYGKSYSPGLVSRFNKELGEALLLWQERPIEKDVAYLYLDAVNLPIKRDRASKEALLCAVGVTDTGEKEFLDFLLGGRECQISWEKLLLRIKRRGLKEEEPKLAIGDGNHGLLAALKTCFSDVPIQRCTVHKLQNIARHCPRAIQQSVLADAKRIIYASSQKEAREEFSQWKRRYQHLAPKAVGCLEKDLEDTLRFMNFRYKIWASIRTTNLIERAFREFRRRIKVMDTFPTEESCIRIMFSLVQLINEGWEDKPFKHFRKSTHSS